MRTAEMIRRARRMGREAARNAASWVFDGNTTEETYRAVLKMIEDGDPVFYDNYRVPDLSGEWADSETPQTLAEYFGSDVNAPRMDAVCTAWEEGAATFEAEVEKIIRAHLS